MSCSNRLINASIFSTHGVLLTLALLMILSRPYALSGVVHLTDASNAIFFLAGLMLLPGSALLMLLGLAVGLDFLSIALGTDAFCISPAYGFLLPAYSLLWFSGRWLGRSVPAESLSLWRPLVILTGFALVQVAAFFITSGAFWYLSGRFVDPDLQGLLARTELYLPGYMMGSIWYLAIYLVVEQLLRTFGFSLRGSWHG